MILITGASGQLGSELRHLLDERGIDYVATDVAQLDITDLQQVEAVFKEVKPSIVYHCAAYTAVDRAETDGRELNEAINVIGTENIAKVSAQFNAKMVYISTDYVFDGDKPLGQEWQVDEPTHPLSQYGIAKRKGEELVETLNPNFYVVRTSWAFSSYGNNFVFTMQKLAETMSELQVVNDQHGRPTWMRTLAEFITHLIDTEQNYGYYQLTNDSETAITWYEFASEILKNDSVTVKPVDSSQFIQAAKRPFNSAMSLSKAKSTGFIIPIWQDALAKMLEQGDLRTK
jgi:dTDP-4-dehydrorhamnose reductase